MKTSLQHSFKREFVIAQLVQLGITEIEGKPLYQQEYRTLHRILAAKRAANQ